MENSEYTESIPHKKKPVNFCAKVTKWTFILYNLLLLVKADKNPMRKTF